MQSDEDGHWGLKSLAQTLGLGIAAGRKQSLNWDMQVGQELGRQMPQADRVVFQAECRAE